MYECSQDYHTAIENGNEQKALLIFPDCVFTDDDIVIDRGIEFFDNFNMDEDICIGQATSNEIRFSLVNDNRLLNNYEFGEFLATIGVHINTASYNAKTGETVRAVHGQSTFIAYNTYPYVKMNDAPTSTQPVFIVQAMLAYGGKVWCFSGDGRYIVYNSTTGANITSNNPLNAFMIEKSKRWIGKGIMYNDSRRMYIWQGGKRYDYEFCPLGQFNAERPKAPDVIQIDMTCYDFMQKFEKDMRDVSVTFPISIKNLFIRLCTVADVQYKLPNPFINGDAIIQKRPDDFDDATMRDVLKWIAEASATNARFDRDGKLTLAWLNSSTGQSLNETNYSEFNPYWYETKTVTKLYNRNTQDNSQTSYGNGDEAYLIQDNPLLRGVT